MDKKSMVFIVAALAAAFLIGANTNGVPDEIRAKKFVVVDDDGKEMLALSSIGIGGVIVVYGKDGKTAASISGSEDGGNIFVHGKDEKPAASITGSENGGNISVYGKDGTFAASIRSTKIGGFISVYDADPDTQGGVALTNNTEGGLIVIVNKTGEDVIQIMVDEYGNGVVGAYNRKGVGRTLQPGP